MDRTEYYKRIEYYKEYYKKNKKDILKKTKEYRSRPKVKIMRQEYCARPENRLRQKEYNKEYYPKNKERLSELQKEYGKEYRKIPKVIARQKKWVENNRGRSNEIKRDWIKNNMEKIKEIRRKYSKKYPERIRESQRKWQRNNLENKNKMQKIYAKKYPEKIKAQQIANRIPLGKKCQICGSTIKLERHHWRYDKPKLFATLCKECHTIQHRRKLL